MQVVAFNTRIVLCPAVCAKIKRRLEEAIRLIVTRGHWSRRRAVARNWCFWQRISVWTSGECLVRCKPRFFGIVLLMHRRLDVYGSADYRGFPHAVFRASWPYA
jgi:hypothetical protein